MDAIRNVANAAAGLVGYDTTTQQDQTRTGTSHISGGEAPQNVEHTSNAQSGVEPVSGKLGSGRAGEPYDAGNMEGAAGLGGSSVQNPASSSITPNTSSNYTPTNTTSDYSSAKATTGYPSTTTNPASAYASNDNNKSTSQEGYDHIKEKVFGPGGSSKDSGLAGGEKGPGFGHGSKQDTSRLGSAIGHGSNPDAHLYNGKNAPGIGGHQMSGDDDFTDSNTRHEGADKLPGGLGSDSNAGSSKLSGLGSGSTNKNSGRSGDRDTTRDSSGFGTGAATGLASTLGYGRQTGTEPVSGARGSGVAGEPYDGGNTRGYDGAAPQNASSLAGKPGYTSTTGIGTTGLGGKSGNSGNTGYADLVDDGCEATHSGYKPHGGHPIGEAAHQDVNAKQTWLDYRNNTSIPLGRGRPADKDGVNSAANPASTGF